MTKSQPQLDSFWNAYTKMQNKHQIMNYTHQMELFDSCFRDEIVSVSNQYVATSGKITTTPRLLLEHLQLNAKQTSHYECTH